MMFFSFSLHAQVGYKINENNYQKINISFTFGELKTIDVHTDNGYFSRIYMDGCGGSYNPGNPELPVSVNMLEVPIFGDYVLNVYGEDFVIYDASALGIHFPVYPSQPPVSKSHTGPVEFIQNKNTYQTDAFYSLPLARFEETGMMRNINLGTLYVSPVQYNPVTQEIKIYKAMDVEILFKKTEFVKTQMIKELHKSPLFRPSNIINPMNNGKTEFSKVPVKYLIVAHSMFRGELDEFMAWKKRKGFLVDIGYTDDENVGTTTASITHFIKSYYDDATPENPAPTYVLLVGDVQQIPTFMTGGHATDLYYFTWVGGNIPSCYYGRFSAQNIDHLTPQIEKTLQYEQFTMPDPNYLNDAVLVAGYDVSYSSKWANGFVNYATQYYINTANGYTNVHAHLHPCTHLAAQIRDQISAGVGLANYTAHCNFDSWYNPRFDINDISAMNNLNKYGLMIGSCCGSNKFNLDECFGEALLRAPGKGAVGYIGGSDLTYWDEDYYWAIGFRSLITANPTYDSTRLGAYDRLFHMHEEPHDKWMTTFSSMMVAGNEAVQTSTSYLKKYYWEIYHLMGDPSVMTYLTKPSQMQVIVSGVFEVGINSMDVKAVPYAYCALTKNGELVAAGFADVTGNITLNFESAEAPGEYEFAAWAQNYIQYFKTIRIYPQNICENSKTIPCYIYPNPAHNILTIETENQIFSYEIIDITGKVITSKQNINNNLVQVNLTLLTSGIYFVKIIDNEHAIAVQKFVKQ
jgi:hypothetical protein